VGCPAAAQQHVRDFREKGCQGRPAYSADQKLVSKLALWATTPASDFRASASMIGVKWCLAPSKSLFGEFRGGAGMDIAGLIKLDQEFPQGCFLGVREQKTAGFLSQTVPLGRIRWVRYV
jgi:hypothetical protein